MDKKRTGAIKEDILKKLAIVLKQGQFYDADNAVVMNSVDALINLLNPIIEREGAQKIDLVGDIFYLNNARVKYSVKSSLIFENLYTEFVKRDLGTVAFTLPLTVDDIRIFLTEFGNAAHKDNPFESLKHSLEGLRAIEVDRLKQVAEDVREGHDTDRRKIVRKTYFNAVSFTRGFMSRLESHERISVKTAKRVVGTMIDAILNEEQLLFGLSALKDFDDYTYHHSVNVSVLSISMGQRIGFTRKSLVELGLAALFHDIGKTAVPKEILNKPESFTEEEWKIIRKHPHIGALSILGLKELDRTIICNAIVAMEHHMNNDMTGYPGIRGPLTLDVYSRIITIADRYDAMTSSRIYQRVPYPPDEALRIMIRHREHYDPDLLNLFIMMVGLYPPGSLVLLDSGEMGVVAESSRKFADRPKVRVIVDGSGERVDEYTVDLAEKNLSGEYVKSIRKTLDPNKYHLNLADYLL